MSTTSTQGTTALVQGMQQVLNDYTIHLTGDGTSNTRPQGIESPYQRDDRLVENPPGWPTAHYRVPDYRPVNRNLIPEERPNGTNAIERTFLAVMFTGVYLNAASAKLWGATGGPYFPGLFRYAIGGEW